MLLFLKLHELGDIRLIDCGGCHVFVHHRYGRDAYCRTVP